MRLTGLACFLFAGAHLASAAEVGPGGASDQRLSDIGPRRICLRLHEDQRRDPRGVDQCSCSIDVIASLIPYDAYVAGETVASMNQAGGQIGPEFRGATIARDALAPLRRAQAEGEVRCF